MATTTWSSFTNDVLVDMAGCSIPIAEQAVRDTAIDFCKRTLVWVYDPGAIAVGADLADYQLEPPSGAKVERVLEVKVDGYQLTPKSPDELNTMYSDWASEEGFPRFYVSPEDAETIYLVPRPEESATMSQRLALRPSQSATGIDSMIYERYREAIVCGAKARLLAMPNKAWSNPAYATDQRLAYQRHVSVAMGEALRGFSRAPLRVAMRPAA